MLEDARHDNKDTDTEYLKRKCEISRLGFGISRKS